MSERQRDSDNALPTITDATVVGLSVPSTTGSRTESSLAVLTLLTMDAGPTKFLPAHRTALQEATPPPHAKDPVRLATALPTIMTNILVKVTTTKRRTFKLWTSLLPSQW